MGNNDVNDSDSFLFLLEKGDKDAFKIIFDTYYKRLYSFSLQYVDDTYAAEEIVEEALLKLWQKRHKLAKVENLKSYLYTMVRNASLDFLKKEKKYVRLDVKKHGSITIKEHYIIEEETHAILYQALESLPKKCRRIFELSCLDGVKYKDIAEDLQISINTVKSQRSRAIELLKAHLKKYSFFYFFFVFF